MGLFDFWNRKNGNGMETLNGADRPKPVISENLFTDKEKQPDNAPTGRQGEAPADNGIYFLYEFLEKNYEAKGYDDALMNPDNTHLEHNIECLKNDLARTIRKVKTYYEDLIKKINFHISSRGRSGMVDVVEELSMQKETAEDHIKQVKEIEEDAKQNRGLGQGVIMSYTRGFRNGLAAISHHTILKRNS